jgi:protein-S-isoprenylcysteine O-methyltransferase Ste14
MNGGFLFLVFFIIQFLGMIVIRIYYGWKSPDRKKSLRELTKNAFKHEGRLSFILLILVGIFMLAALILYIFYMPIFPWLVLPFPDWLRWIGVIIGFISLFLLWWVHSTLGRAFSKALTIQERHIIVSDGAYRRVRHPMYTTFLFYFFSWFLISTNILFLITWILFLFVVFARMPKEEEMLLEQFGDEYRAYMNRTGRLLPPLHKKDTSNEINQRIGDKD